MPTIGTHEINLPALASAYPQLQLSLWEPLALLADGPARQPYQTEEEYFREVELQFVIRALILEHTEALSRPSTQRSADEIDHRLRLVDDLRKILEALDSHVQYRLQELPDGSPAPRMVRLAESLGLNECEVAIFQYLVVSQVGQTVQRILIGDLDRTLLGLSRFLGFSMRDVALFAQASRRHVQERMILVRDRGSAFSQELSVAEPVMKALLGMPLGINEFLSIEETPLGSLLQEEPDFEPHALASDLSIGADEFGTEEIDGAQAERVLPPLESNGDIEDLYRGSPAIESEEDVHPSRRNGGAVCIRAEEEAPLRDLPPYGNDLEYLEEWFHFAANRMRIRKLELEDPPRSWDREAKDPQQQLAEYRAKEAVLKARMARRLEISRSARSWVPRIERLTELRGLDEFEKTILLTLIGVNLSIEIQKAADSRLGAGGAEIGDVLVLWCDSLSQMVGCRKYFRRNARLVKEGMIKLSEYARGTFMRLDIEIDPRLLDYIVGLDVNAADLVDGSHLYTPSVRLDQVVLPKDQKQLIVDAVTNFEAFKSNCDKFGLTDAIAYGRSLVLLFFGASGTGKTMMANALATHLGKRLLLINFPALGGNASAEILKAIFREARIQDAVLFFDECEALFLSRDRGNSELGLLMTELERHDGLAIMATNRPFDLDEAMHRRITLAVEFRQPDPFLREEIWRTLIPSSVPLAEGIDFRRLAMTFELSGGFIKNAVMTALSLAVSRDKLNPLVTEADLEQGARLQLRSRLRMQDFDRRVVPARGLEALVLPDKTRRLLDEIVLAEKARNILFGQWGFDQMPGAHRGIAALFHGAPGTGKSLAAEAIAYEVGRPLMVVNCAELVSKYVGETGKNIEAVFREASQNDSLLLFDEADGLFAKRTAVDSSSDRYANMDVGLLLYHVERFQGVVLLATNLREEIDEALYRRLRFVVEFVAPDETQRLALWRHLIPAKLPLSQYIDLLRLARHPLTGGQIRNVILRAASRAAMKLSQSPCVDNQDLEEAVALESVERRTRNLGFLNGSV